MSVFVPGSLLQQLELILTSAGMQPGPAAVAAEVLVRADARGYEGNGVMQLPTYVRQMLAGELASRVRIRRSRPGSLMVVDGGATLGHVVVAQSVRWAVAAARRRPMVATVMHSLGYTGVLGAHVQNAAEAGFLALLLQTTHPFLAAPGGGPTIIGNNPVAFAAPVRGELPLVVDLALSAASLGKVRVAAMRGEPIPSGWAVDAGGRPTNDAAEAILGGLLPAGGYKGLGLALLVECLAGGLSPEPRRTGLVEAFLLVVNPDLVSGRDEYEARLHSSIQLYRSTGERLPGRRAQELEALRFREGIPMPDSVLGALRETAELVGAPFILGSTPAT